MSSSQNPHDRFFRNAFARQEIAQGFFERYLPAEVSAQLDFTTLRLTKESFVDDALKVQQSDLLFHIQTRSGIPARLYLLLEHKSYPDPWVALQILGYLVRIWEQEKQRRKKPPLPVVIPLVLPWLMRSQPRSTGRVATTGLVSGNAASAKIQP